MNFLLLLMCCGFAILCMTFEFRRFKSMGGLSYFVYKMIFFCILAALIYTIVGITTIRPHRLDTVEVVSYIENETAYISTEFGRINLNARYKKNISVNEKFLYTRVDYKNYYNILFFSTNDLVWIKD